MAANSIGGATSETSFEGQADHPRIAEHRLQAPGRRGSARIYGRDPLRLVRRRRRQDRLFPAGPRPDLSGRKRHAYLAGAAARQGAPGARSGTAWSATLWGQPAGIALAAVAALLAGDVAAAISAWLAVSVLFWMAAIRASAEAIARTGRRLLAVALFAAAVAQPAVHGGGDPVAWIVDIVLAATGIIMLLPDLRTMRTSATSAICDSRARS